MNHVLILKAYFKILFSILLHSARYTKMSHSKRFPLTYLLTYLLTPWSRVLLEKLTGSAASQEIPRIFGTRRFLTVLTSARHLSLSWANSIQSPQPPPDSWRSILILSSHQGLTLCIYLLRNNNNLSRAAGIVTVYELQKCIMHLLIIFNEENLVL